jgi:hypothetical protein
MNQAEVLGTHRGPTFRIFDEIIEVPQNVLGLLLRKGELKAERTAPFLWVGEFMQPQMEIGINFPNFTLSGLDVTASGMFQVLFIYSLPRKQSACAENFTVRS